MLTTAYKSAISSTNRTLNNEEIRQLRNPTNFSKVGHQRSDTSQYSKHSNSKLSRKSNSPQLIVEPVHHPSPFVDFGNSIMFQPKVPAPP